MAGLVLIGLAALVFLGGLKAFDRARIGSAGALLSWAAILAGLSLILMLVLTGREGFALGIAILAGPFLWERWRAMRRGR